MDIEITRREYEKLRQNPEEIPAGFEVDMEASYFLRSTAAPAKIDSTTHRRRPTSVLKLAENRSRKSMTDRQRAVLRLFEELCPSERIRSSVITSQVHSRMAMGEDISPASVSGVIGELVKKGIVVVEEF